MTRDRFPRLHRLCDALPATNYDEHFSSLPPLQQWLVLLATAVVVLTIPELLLDAPDARVAVAVPLALGVFAALSGLLARYNRG